MKALLINPWEPDIFPNPSIGYLQVALKRRQIDVTALNLQEALVAGDDFDFVAVTFHSFSVKYAKAIRKHFKNHLVCGGHHPSAMPEQMLSIGYDQVVVGEGENAIIDIAQGNRDKIIKSEDVKSKYYPGINELPIPDYTGLNFKPVMGTPIISSRGCPFDCSFCASSNFWGKSYKARSVENVLYELETLKKKGLTDFMFEDDNFTLNRQRAIDICKGIKEIGGLRWQCASRAESLEDELCCHFKSSGCHTVWLGIESLSQSSLDRCNKKTTVEKMISGIKTAGKYGLETMSQFIIGLPGDSIDDINETERQIKTNNIYHRGTNILWILPNTEAHRKAKEKGFSDETFLISGAPFYTYEQNINTLNHWSHLINTAI